MSGKRRSVEQRFARMPLRDLSDPGCLEKRVFDTWNLEYSRAVGKGFATRPAQARASKATARKFKTSVRNVQIKVKFWREIEKLRERWRADTYKTVLPSIEASNALEAILGDELHAFDQETAVADLFPLAACRAAKRIARLESENAELRAALELAKRKQATAERSAREAEIRVGALELSSANRAQRRV